MNIIILSIIFAGILLTLDHVGIFEKQLKEQEKTNE
jgi:hypothetical protein|tara:strand:+ start:2707 stop:2814 length:108 start_codon:yes stop_codon:yes gene_type:complete